MLEAVTEAFAKLGLKENERKVYLACLRSEAGLHVQEIADGTHIKRGTVNLVLERLARKGFVAHHIEGRRKVFTAEPPERVATRLQEAVEDFRGVLPLLFDTRLRRGRSRARFFEGTSGLEQIFDDILLTARLERHPRKREILAVSSTTDILTVLPRHEEQFIRKRVREGIPLRWIAPDTPSARRYAARGTKEYRRMKLFNTKKYPFRIEMDIYGDNLALLSLEDLPSGLIFENAPLADSFRSLFNLLWDRL